MRDRYIVPHRERCVCGTGIGISIAANKVRGVRAAVVHDVSSARLAREHNDANVICFGARLVGPAVAADAVDVFLSSGFEGGRHLRRIEKIAGLEEPRFPTSSGPSERSA